jgi:competence protein ComFC
MKIKIQSLYKALQHTGKTFFNFILPSRCIICEKEIEQGLICTTCLDYLPLLHPPLCPICGRSIQKGSICSYCRNNTSLDHGRAWLPFVPPVDTVLHHFKYQKKTTLAQLCGRAMASLVQHDAVLRTADCVMPVPLYWWKSLRRGYNQSELLAATIADNCNLPLIRVIKRTRNTRTQTRLNETARRKNVSGAFVAVNTAVENKNVLLVDDVMTTGATMNECASVLKDAGAAAVYSCVAAITL